MKILLNMASRFPQSAYLPGYYSTQALKDGFDGITIHPTWGEYLWGQPLKGVYYVEEPWNPGPVWRMIIGRIQNDPKAPLLQDVVLFPWYEFMWKPDYDNFVRNGLTPIVHTFAEAREGAILEISPRLMITGAEIVERAIRIGIHLCFDTKHAIRKLWAFEGGPASSSLGTW